MYVLIWTWNFEYLQNHGENLQKNRNYAPNMPGNSFPKMFRYYGKPYTHTHTHTHTPILNPSGLFAAKIILNQIFGQEPSSERWNCKAHFSPWSFSILSNGNLSTSYIKICHGTSAFPRNRPWVDRSKDATKRRVETHCTLQLEMGLVHKGLTWKRRK